jgi:transcriptional regulator of nitric oxide reductase
MVLKGFVQRVRAKRAPKDTAVQVIGSLPARRGRVAWLIIALLTGGATLVVAGGQPANDQQAARLKRLFPSAAAFSPKGGDPPHVKALAGPKGDSIVGYAVWTTEVVPLERGYGGPIAIMVGVDAKGVITGIVMGEHHEPYGDFSIDRPEFAAQFRGKDVRDPFRLGEDIDAVSRATITMSSAVRAIRNSARRVARQFIAPPAKS